MYRIDYNTGAEDVVVESDDLDAAKAEADERIAYTQQSIVISDADGNEVTRREWYSVLDGIDECEDPIQFGKFGYYSDWQ